MKLSVITVHYVHTCGSQTSGRRPGSTLIPPTPAPTCGGGLMSITLGLCASPCFDRCTSSTTHTIHLTALDPSVLTDAVSPDDTNSELQKTIINRHQESLQLKGCSFGDHWSIKKKPKPSWAADSCVPDVYVSSSRLTNAQTAISLNWD